MRRFSMRAKFTTRGTYQAISFINISKPKRLMKTLKRQPFNLSVLEQQIGDKSDIGHVNIQFQWEWEWGDVFISI